MSKKLDRLMEARATDPEMCYADKSRSTVIDTIRPDGLTTYRRETFEQIRTRYPNAELMSLDDFCAWKAEQQRTPIVWEETTEERYFEMLEVLPPALMASGGFLVGEAYDHDAGNGQPRFQAFRKRSGAFEVANRPMTVSEFREAVKNP